MKRQINISSLVTSFNMEAVNGSIQTDLKAIIDDFTAFSYQNLTLTEAGIDLDRKTLYSWKKQGILPYTGFPKKNGKNKTWGRFSFIELCWLKMLMEFRSMGVGIDKLKEIKDFFFDPAFLYQFFSRPLAEVENMPAEFLHILSEKGSIKNGNLLVNTEMSEAFEEIQFSLFSNLLYSTMLSKSNIVFYVDGKGKFEAVDLNQLAADPIEGVMNFHKLLSNESVAFVNIKKIIADLSNTHEYFSQNPQFAQKLSDSSVASLRELFKNGKVREVTIRVAENGNPTAWIKKEMSIQDLEKEFYRIRKKGNFCDILVKTRDGNIQYFEHTEIIKL